MTEIQAGDVAPDFTLPQADGTAVSLRDYRGKPVVLYWYPRDDTPGCTAEACSYRDNLAVLQSKGAVVLGASADSIKSHQKFAKKYALGFPLLADIGHAVAEQYGVWVEKRMYGRAYMGIARSTFLIAPDGTVARVWHNVNPKAVNPSHVEQVMAALEELHGTVSA